MNISIETQLHRNFLRKIAVREIIKADASITNVTKDIIIDHTSFTSIYSESQKAPLRTTLHKVR